MSLEKLLAKAEANPRDVEALRRVGEWYQKHGDHVNAARWFAKIAAEYERDGTFLKAIALYKQVFKLDPKQPEIARRLAELHAGLQLNEEAWAYFTRARQGFLQAADSESARAVAERVRALGLEDPGPPKARA